LQSFSGNLSEYNFFENATLLHPDAFRYHLIFTGHKKSFCQASSARQSLEDEGATGNVNNGTLPMEERLLRIDHIQARRYSKLSGTTLDIATEGILRHLRACDRMDVNPDISAVREIIDDALNGRRIYAETANDRRAA